jgi:probable phosphoglycerate mutase
VPVLYVVRHAETEPTGRLAGRSDARLSELGLRAAQERLGRLRVQAVYTSPLRRALETAQAFEETSLEVLEELTEVGLGEWEGLSWSEAARQDPERARRKLEDWFRVPPPGGEPWEALTRRVARGLERIRRGPFPAAVVGHLAVNAELARQIAGEDPLAFRQDYCEVRAYDL